MTKCSQGILVLLLTFQQLLLSLSHQNLRHDVAVDIHPSFTGLKVEEAKNFLGTNTIEHSGGPLPLYPDAIVPEKEGNSSTSVPHQSKIA